MKDTKSAELLAAVMAACTGMFIIGFLLGQARTDYPPESYTERGAHDLADELTVLHLRISALEAEHDR